MLYACFPLAFTIIPHDPDRPVPVHLEGGAVDLDRVYHSQTPSCVLFGLLVSWFTPGYFPFEGLNLGTDPTSLYKGISI